MESKARCFASTLSITTVAAQTVCNLPGFLVAPGFDDVPIFVDLARLPRYAYEDLECYGLAMRLAAAGRM